MVVLTNPPASSHGPCVKNFHHSLKLAKFSSALLPLGLAALLARQATDARVKHDDTEACAAAAGSEAGATWRRRRCLSGGRLTAPARGIAPAVAAGREATTPRRVAAKSRAAGRHAGADERADMFRGGAGGDAQGRGGERKVERCRGCRVTHSASVRRVVSPGPADQCKSSNLRLLT